MKKENSIVLFHQKTVRRHWDEELELWYFSIIDVVAVLSDSSNPKRYWSDLKIKLKQEGSGVYDNIVHLKMLAPDGKKYITDEWQERGMKQGLEYAILTDEITRAWADNSVKEYKHFKDLKKQNLRDNMTNLELVLNCWPRPRPRKYPKRKNRRPARRPCGGYGQKGNRGPDRREYCQPGKCAQIAAGL